jgi:hypothetical protein
VELTVGIAIVHLVAGLMVVGYAQNYYFHLRESRTEEGWVRIHGILTPDRSPQEQRTLGQARIPVQLWKVWKTMGQTRRV